MAVKIYHGDILFTPAADRMEIHENSYIIVDDLLLNLKVI